jgi:hypothetical protein
MLFNGPYVHQTIAHRETRHRANTVGVAHSSYRPIPVWRFSSTLAVLWNLFLSLVTVGYVLLKCLPIKRPRMTRILWDCVRMGGG